MSEAGSDLLVRVLHALGDDTIEELRARRLRG